MQERHLSFSQVGLKQITLELQSKRVIGEHQQQDVEQKDEHIKYNHGKQQDFTQLRTCQMQVQRVAINCLRAQN